jgi:hypothetical protein
LLKNLIRALLIFNGLRTHHGQRALLGYHYLFPSFSMLSSAKAGPLH